MFNIPNSSLHDNDLLVFQTILLNDDLPLFFIVFLLFWPLVLSVDYTIIEKAQHIL